MFSYVEETEEGTVLYQVRTYRWCMCWAFFNASEVFELTGIPYLYRKFLGIPRKPTFLEWLTQHRRLWSSKTVYPRGTRFFTAQSYKSNCWENWVPVSKVNQFLVFYRF